MRECRASLILNTLHSRPQSKYALKHYMAYFDFANMRVDEAFRQFCQKLYLKAETQEIDRILGGFSERYFECNPMTIFGSPSEFREMALPRHLSDLRVSSSRDTRRHRLISPSQYRSPHCGYHPAHVPQSICQAHARYNLRKHAACVGEILDSRTHSR